jgi:hypothetical protein
VAFEVFASFEVWLLLNIVDANALFGISFKRAPSANCYGEKESGLGWQAGW